MFCLVPDICGKSAFVSEVFMCNSGFPVIFAQRIHDIDIIQGDGQEGAIRGNRSWSKKSL